MKKIFILFYLLFLISYSSFSQNVGIGTTAPLEKLHVSGNVKADTVKPNVLKIATNAGSGKILTSDAAGNGSWQTGSSTVGGNVGFGPWGDCSTNAIGEYNPVADANGAANSSFGDRVAISGIYAVVGAPVDDIGANTDQGSASIYQYNGSNWVFMQKLTDATGAAGDYFGFYVAISGNYAIIGAPSDDVGANTDQGSVSIYQFNGSSWVLMQKITDPGGSALDIFGSSLSVSANYVVVGSAQDDIGANTDQGSASIFQYNGSNWVFMQKLTDATGDANDLFGGSVSISGSFVIAGAVYDDNGSQVDQGSASIFQYNGTNWGLMEKITDPDGFGDDFFGQAVSISGNDAIVGAYRDDVGANLNQGSACIFHYNGSGWEPLQKIIESNGSTGEAFGVSVAISGNYAIVGSPFDNVGANTIQGSATIFQKVGMGWGKLQYITDPAGSTNDYFGYSTAIDGTNKRFLIGAAGFVNNRGKAVFGKIN